MIPGYPKVYRADTVDANPFYEYDGRVVIQEKLDGSQFSFSMGADSSVSYRSKRKAFNKDNANDLFQPAVSWIEQNKSLLDVGTVYRGEALARPRHNHLTYKNPPAEGFVLFGTDGDRGFNVRLPFVDTYYSGFPEGNTKAERYEWLESFLGRESMLGGCRAEGVVVKSLDSENPMRHEKSGDELFVKLVRPDFQESNKIGKNMKVKFDQDDILAQIGGSFATDARFMKAVSRLEEEGELSFTNSDIGKLLKELNLDFEEENAEQCKQLLWNWGRKAILRNSNHEFAKWYQSYLKERMFAETEALS